jgi:hypothetical protein
MKGRLGGILGMAKQFRNINIETGRVEGAYSSGNGNRITNVAPDPGLLITSIAPP